MKNPLKVLDDYVLAATNKAVHAYNWTTGGTKTNLAGVCLDCGAIMASVGTLGFFAVLYIPSRGTALRDFEEIEQKEAAANEQGLKDSEVENAKKDYRNMGYCHIGASLILKDISTIGSFGFFLMSFANHSMRADYLPPQKNCIERLSDLIQDYKDQRTLLSETERVR
jgi:hypothetical protein